jgi:hypothetical protein
MLLRDDQINGLVNGTSYQRMEGFDAANARTFAQSHHIAKGMYYIVITDRSLGIQTSKSTEVKVFAKLRQ